MNSTLPAPTATPGNTATPIQPTKPALPEVHFPFGKFTQDPSGVWNYTSERTSLGAAIEGLFTYRLRLPLESVIFFWWQGLCCPVVKGDAADRLTERYFEWSSSFRGTSPENTVRRFAFYEQDSGL